MDTTVTEYPLYDRPGQLSAKTHRSENHERSTEESKAGNQDGIFMVSTKIISHHSDLIRDRHVLVSADRRKRRKCDMHLHMSYHMAPHNALITCYHDW